MAAREAVAATLYEKEQLDPNRSHNARSKTIYNNIPTRGEADRGRIGIEIDGASHLFRSGGMTDDRAVRLFSVYFGAELAKGPWKGYESIPQKFTRPVVMYFNTIKQSLIACEELANLKRIPDASTTCNDVIIKTLGQDPKIPKSMLKKRKSTKGLLNGRVEPKQGIVIVVQPTDFNAEFQPPGPAVNSVSHLQQLVARAAIENLPVIIISPRFLRQQPFESNSLDLSGFQRSAVYGGDEPPRGPAPWILRDFFPPAFAWIGSAVTLSRLEHQESNDSSSLQFSRVSMMQSVLNKDRSWDLFGVKQDNQKLVHQYLASTSTSAGRPTMAIVKYIFEEWSS
eukprot:CAMPEP_0194225092 /NCGR_PEP_ID=MMETSP0156-20130528/38805_1 /TAXON_ID=33649 /ORGANISM="Thalassionema nitzschioides, Strain L26-B" /LENGTH=339 /DNA_ID=CAMNT_0038956903 /DNA_START=285 /DNA_END=1304 /DNA_ORIENTATION=+